MRIHNVDVELPPLIPIPKPRYQPKMLIINCTYMSPHHHIMVGFSKFPTMVNTKNGPPLLMLIPYLPLTLLHHVLGNQRDNHGRNHHNLPCLPCKNQHPQNGFPPLWLFFLELAPHEEDEELPLIDLFSSSNAELGVLPILSYFTTSFGSSPFDEIPPIIYYCQGNPFSPSPPSLPFLYILCPSGSL